MNVLFSFCQGICFIGDFFLLFKKKMVWNLFFFIINWLSLLKGLSTWIVTLEASQSLFLLYSNPPSRILQVTQSWQGLNKVEGKVSGLENKKEQFQIWKRTSKDFLLVFLKWTNCLAEAQTESGTCEKKAGWPSVCSTVVPKWEQPCETSARILLLTLLMGKASDMPGGKWKKKKNFKKHGTTPITWSLDHTPEREEPTSSSGAQPEQPYLPFNSTILHILCIKCL